MRFAATRSAREPNIEDTLLSASIEGMERDDLRVLAVLATWFRVHSARVNADRLTQLVAAHSDRVRALWAALAKGSPSDRRFAKLARGYKGPRLDLLRTGTEFQVRRRGEDSRFAGGPVRVPAGVLRDREDDVLSPAALARRHRAYRYRVQMGPSFRADCWAALAHDTELAAAAVARRTYASFATAWQAKRDFAVLQPAART